MPSVLRLMLCRIRHKLLEERDGGEGARLGRCFGGDCNVVPMTYIKPTPPGVVWYLLPLGSLYGIGEDTALSFGLASRE